MRKKKIKVRGAEELIANMPEDQRESAREAIADLVKHLEYGGGMDKPVVTLPPGTRKCPKCGHRLTMLRRLATNQYATPEDRAAQLAECSRCDLPYSIKGTN